MPEAEVAKRGGSIRTRTISLPGNKFKRCEIVRKAGPRGGHTVCGPTRTKKSAREALGKRRKR